MMMANVEAVYLRCLPLNQCSLTIVCRGIRLDHIPDDIPNIVKSLVVSNNIISKVSHKDLGRFPLLEYLDVSFNSIEDLSSDTFSALTFLKKLDLSYNKLKWFHPRTFTQNRNLTHLSIVGNPLQTAVDSPVLSSDTLKSLELDLAMWYYQTFNDLTSLEQLAIHWKKGVRASSGTFQQLYRLREVIIICRELCDEWTITPHLKNYFDSSGVKIVFTVTTIARQDIDTNEECEKTQGIEKVSSGPRQGNISILSHLIVSQFL